MMNFVVGAVGAVAMTVLLLAIFGPPVKRPKIRNAITENAENWSRFADRMEKARQEVVTENRPCGTPCHRCIKEFDIRDETVQAFRLNSVVMILCEHCGNKRCPHASDHRLSCRRATNRDSLVRSTGSADQCRISAH